MKFCNNCRRRMIIDPRIEGGPMYTCEACGESRLGMPADTMLETIELTAGNTAAQSALLIQNAPFDPASMREHRTCDKCKLNYMAVLVLDQGSRIVYSCKCGNVIDRKY